MCPLSLLSAGSLSLCACAGLMCAATVSVTSCEQQSCCVWKTVSLESPSPLDLKMFLPPDPHRLLCLSGLTVPVSDSLPYCSLRCLCDNFYLWPDTVLWIEIVQGTGLRRLLVICLKGLLSVFPKQNDDIQFSHRFMTYLFSGSCPL